MKKILFVVVCLVQPSLQHRKTSSIFVKDVALSIGNDKLKVFEALLLTVGPFSRPRRPILHRWLRKGEAEIPIMQEGSEEEKESIPRVRLRSGASVPQLSVSLDNVPRENVRDVINAALEAGVRSFDFASVHDNELECGEVLKEWLAEGHDRSELYITTKVWTTDLISPESAKRSAEISINELDLGPVDCLMVHWPVPGKHIAAYKALEEVVQLGKAKALGISNYSPADYEELMMAGMLAPDLNTFENKPALYRKDWVDYFHEQGVAVMAYRALGQNSSLREKEVVGGIAERLRKTPTQIRLKWNIQKGNLVAFRSKSPEHIVENINDDDFELPEEDIAALDVLTDDSAREEAQKSWEENRNGMPAPWGDSLRPERRVRGVEEKKGVLKMFKQQKKEEEAAEKTESDAIEA